METNTIIKKGYKQTELGVIPKDWEVKDLGQVAKFSQGVQVNLNKQIKEEQTGYIKFLRIENYTQLSDDFRYIPIEYGNNKIVDEDEIVVVRYGATAGFVGTGFKGVLANNLFKVEPNPKYLSKEYLYRYMKGETTYSYFQNSMFGGAMPALSFKVVKSFIIPIPTKPEQKAIATVLSDTDALIESLEKLITKKKAIKQGAMQQLLTGKRRLPGFGGKWEVTNLGKVAEFVHGRGLSKSDLDEEGTCKCIHYGQLFTTYKELIQEVNSRTNKNDGCFYSRENDVLMPTSDVTPRGLATASCIKETGVILGGGILVIRLHPGYDGLYFSYFVTQNKIFVLKLVKGSTVFHLYANDLATLEVCFPNFQEQIAIARVLSDMDAEIESLEQKRDKYVMLKHGMMRQLLTGRIRIYANN